MKEIQTVPLTHMNNAAHFLFVSNMADRAEKDSSVAAKCAAQVAALRDAVQAEDENLQISAKSLTTDKIADADRLRDQLYAGYKKAVAGYTGFPVESLADAAKVLNQHIKDYKIDTQAQLDKETGLLVNFIQDLEGQIRRASEGIVARRIRGKTESCERRSPRTHQLAHGRTFRKDSGRTQSRPHRVRRGIQIADHARERPCAHRGRRSLRRVHRLREYGDRALQKGRAEVGGDGIGQ